MVEVPLTFAELALGADVSVPTLEGSTAIRIPTATIPGKMFRLQGRGLPRTDRGGRGDLHLQMVLDVPEALNDEQRTSLSKWAQAVTPDQHKRRHAFDQALKERQS